MDKTIKLLPYFLHDVEEYKQICNIEDTQFNEFDTKFDKNFKNQFVQTLDMDGLSYWENMFHLNPINQSVEKRKERLITFIQEKRPFTYFRLQKMLNDFCGSGNYTMTMTLNSQGTGYELVIDITGYYNSCFADIQRLCKKIIPCNISYSIKSFDRLNVPTNLRYTGLSNDHVDLQWDSVLHSSAYLVLYSTDSSFNTSTAVYSSTTTKVIENLKANTTYYFKVKSIGDNITYYDSDFSNHITAKTTGETLETPSNLSVNAYGYDFINLNWDSVDNATKYDIMIATDENFITNVLIEEDLLNTHHVFDKLVPYTTYYFKVKAKNPSKTLYADSSYSEVYSFSTNAKKLYTPVISRVNDKGRFVGLIDYGTELIECGGSGTTGIVYQDYIAVSSGDTSWDTGETGNGTYYGIGVQFFGDNVKYLNSEIGSCSRLGGWASHLYFPENFIFENVEIYSSGSNNYNKVTLKWDKALNASSYTISYYYDSGTELTKTIDSGDTLETVIEQLENNKTYYFKIKSNPASGSAYLESEYSNQIIVKTFKVLTQLTAPTLTIGEKTDSSISLSWDSVTNADSYTIQYSTSSSFSSYNTIYGLKELSTIINNLISNTTYYIKIKSVGNKIDYLDSDFSSVKSAKTKSISSKLDVPTNLTNGTVTYDSIELTWDSVENADTYTIKYNDYEKTGISGTNTKLENLDSDTTYSIQVMAVPSEGSEYSPSNYSSAISVSTIGYIKLSTPVEYRKGIDEDSGGSIFYSNFYPVENASGYEGVYSTDNYETTKNLTFVVYDPYGFCEVDDSNLVPHSTIYYKYRAVGSSPYSSSDYVSGTQTVDKVMWSASHCISGENITKSGTTASIVIELLSPYIKTSVDIYLYSDSERTVLIDSQTGLVPTSSTYFNSKTFTITISSSAFVTNYAYFKIVHNGNDDYKESSYEKTITIRQ